MADKLIKIIVDLENKAGDQFKALNAELKKLKENSDDAANALSKVGKSQKQNTAETRKNTNALNDNNSELDNQNKKLKDSGKSFESLKSKLSGFAVAAAGVSAALGAIGTVALSINQEMFQLSNIAGVNADEFIKLTSVYKAFGIEASDVASGIKDVVERINDAAQNNAGEFVDIGKQLGLDPASLAKSRPIEQFKKVVEEISKIGNEGTRISLLDRLGSDALNKMVQTEVKARESFRKIQEEADKLNLTLDIKDTEKLTELSAQFSLLSQNVSLLTQETLASFSDQLVDVTRKFNTFITEMRAGENAFQNLFFIYDKLFKLKIENVFDSANVKIKETRKNIAEFIGWADEVERVDQDINRINSNINKNQSKIDFTEREAILEQKRNENKTLTEREALELNILKIAKDENVTAKEKLEIYISMIGKLEEYNVGMLALVDATGLGEKGIDSFVKKAKELEKIKPSLEVEINGGTPTTFDPVFNPKLLEAAKQGEKVAIRSEVEIKTAELKQSQQDLIKVIQPSLKEAEKFVSNNPSQFPLSVAAKVNLTPAEIEIKQAELTNLLAEKTKFINDEIQKNGFITDKALKASNEINKALKEVNKETSGSARNIDNLYSQIGNAGSLQIFEKDKLDLELLNTETEKYYSMYERGAVTAQQLQAKINEELVLTRKVYGENSAQEEALLNRKNQLSEESIQKQIDNLNYLRETNQITIDEQIAGLDKLSAGLNKNSEMYKNIVLARQELMDQGFEESINKTNLQVRLNEKSTQDLIDIYEEQLKTLDETSLKYLELKVVIKDLKDQQLSEEFQKIDLQMQLHEATIDDVIAKYKALAAATTAGSLENLQARVGQKGAEQAKTDEQESFIQAQLDSDNISYERRNELLTEYQNLLLQQRETIPENTAEYVNLTNQINSLNDDFSVLGVTYGEIGDTIANAGTDAFMSWIDGSKSLKDAFKDMASSIIQDLLQMIIKAYIYQAVMGALGVPTGGAGGAGSGLSGLLGGGGATASLPTRHNGGPVGKSGDSSNGFKSVNLLNPSQSLSSNERLIVAKTDEYVVKSPTVNSPTGVGSNTVTSPNVNIQTYIGDRAIADMFANSDHLQDTIINIYNRNQDKIIR